LFRRTWQSPSNAHAYRLYVVNDPRYSNPAHRRLLSLNLAAISEALYYDRFFKVLSNSAVFAAFSSLAVTGLLAVVSEDSHCSTLFAFSSELICVDHQDRGALMRTPRPETGRLG
jgi:hypothetical protein